jgi:hypothetical protein
MDFLLELVVLLVEFVFELFIELVFGELGDLFGWLEPSTQSKLLAALAYFVVGAAVGLLSAVAWPDRLLPAPRTPGFSLVAGPLLSGYAMHTWGVFRREGGHSTSSLATFWGGAAFALGAALGRFVVVA